MIYYCNSFGTYIPGITKISESLGDLISRTMENISFRKLIIFKDVMPMSNLETSSCLKCSLRTKVKTECNILQCEIL